MKELEIEYKKQIELELPDLWSRIESGVDAYEASKNNDIKNETTKVVEFTNINKQEETQEEKSNKVEKLEDNFAKSKKNKKIVATVMKIVAAAASLFLVVNVISLFGGVKTNDSAAANVQSFAPMADAAATADEAACETAAPEMEAPAAAEEAEWESAEVEEETEHIYDAEEGLATEVAAGTQSEIADSAVNKESIRGETDASEIKGGATVGESAEAELSLEEMTQKLVEAIGCSDEEASDMVLILQSIGVVEIIDVLSYEDGELVIKLIDSEIYEHIYIVHTKVDAGKIVVADIIEADNIDNYLYKR